MGVLSCRNVEVIGEKCRGSGRKTWREWVNDDMKLLGLQLEWTGSVQGHVESFHIGANIQL